MFVLWLNPAILWGHVSDTKDQIVFAKLRWVLMVFGKVHYAPDGVPLAVLLSGQGVLKRGCGGRLGLTGQDDSLNYLEI